MLQWREQLKRIYAFLKQTRNSSLARLWHILYTFSKRFEKFQTVSSVCIYSPVFALMLEVAINYASGICICIDFNKSYFLHASFCTCCRITGVLPNTRHTRLFSRSHAPPLTSAEGNETKKSIIKIIIESPLVWGFRYFFTVAFGNIGGICRNCRGVLV